MDGTEIQVTSEENIRSLVKKIIGVLMENRIGRGWYTFQADYSMGVG
jgi:hypothetical protein